MKSALAVLVTLAVPFLSGHAKTQTAETEIRRLNAREVEALLRNDVKALSLIWSPDFVVTNPLNKFVNRKEVVGLIESNVLAFKSYDREVEYVRAFGDTAIVAGSETVVWAGKMPDAGKPSHLRFTAVWMKHAGRWQELARHANIVDQK